MVSLHECKTQGGAPGHLSLPVSLHVDLLCRVRMEASETTLTPAQPAPHFAVTLRDIAECVLFSRVWRCTLWFTVVL